MEMFFNIRSASDYSFTEDLWQNRNAYTDATIVYDGGRCRTQSHRIVLAAASDFFKKELEGSSNEAAVIHLPHLGSADVPILLEFVYKRSVRLSAENLGKFLALATLLELKGLKTLNYSRCDAEDQKIEEQPKEINLDEAEVWKLAKSPGGGESSGQDQNQDNLIAVEAASTEKVGALGHPEDVEPPEVEARPLPEDISPEHEQEMEPSVENETQVGVGIAKPSALEEDLVGSALEVQVAATQEVQQEGKLEADLEVLQETEPAAELQAEMEDEKEVIIEAGHETQPEDEPEILLEAREEIRTETSQDVQLQAEQKVPMEFEKDAELEAEQEIPLAAEQEVLEETEQEIELRDVHLEAEAEVQEDKAFIEILEETDDELEILSPVGPEIFHEDELPTEAVEDGQGEAEVEPTGEANQELQQESNNEALATFDLVVESQALEEEATTLEPQRKAEVEIVARESSDEQEAETESSPETSDEGSVAIGPRPEALPVTGKDTRTTLVRPEPQPEVEGKVQPEEDENQEVPGENQATAEPKFPDTEEPGTNLLHTDESRSESAGNAEDNQPETGNSSLNENLDTGKCLRVNPEVESCPIPAETSGNDSGFFADFSLLDEIVETYILPLESEQQQQQQQQQPQEITDELNIDNLVSSSVARWQPTPTAKTVPPPLLTSPSKAPSKVASDQALATATSPSSTDKLSDIIAVKAASELPIDSLRGAESSADPDSAEPDQNEKVKEPEDKRFIATLQAEVLAVNRKRKASPATVVAKRMKSVSATTIHSSEEAISAGLGEGIKPQNVTTSNIQLPLAISSKADKQMDASGPSQAAPTDTPKHRGGSKPASAKLRSSSSVRRSLSASSSESRKRVRFPAGMKVDSKWMLDRKLLADPKVAVQMLDDETIKSHQTVSYLSPEPETRPGGAGLDSQVPEVASSSGPGAVQGIRKRGQPRSQRNQTTKVIKSDAMEAKQSDASAKASTRSSKSKRDTSRDPSATKSNLTNGLKLTKPNSECDAKPPKRDASIDERSKRTRRDAKLECDASSNPETKKSASAASNKVDKISSSKKSDKKLNSKSAAAVGVAPEGANDAAGQADDEFLQQLIKDESENGISMAASVPSDAADDRITHSDVIVDSVKCDSIKIDLSLDRQNLPPGISGRKIRHNGTMIKLPKLLADQGWILQRISTVGDYTNFPCGSIEKSLGNDYLKKFVDWAQRANKAVTHSQTVAGFSRTIRVHAVPTIQTHIFIGVPLAEAITGKKTVDVIDIDD